MRWASQVVAPVPAVCTLAESGCGGSVSSWQYLLCASGGANRRDSCTDA